MPCFHKSNRFYNLLCRHKSRKQRTFCDLQSQMKECPCGVYRIHCVQTARSAVQVLSAKKNFAFCTSTVTTCKLLRASSPECLKCRFKTKSLRREGHQDNFYSAKKENKQLFLLLRICMFVKFLLYAFLQINIWQFTPCLL